MKQKLVVQFLYIIYSFECTKWLSTNTQEDEFYYDFESENQQSSLAMVISQ